MIGFVAYDGAVGPLGERLLPDCLKQRAIHDRWLLPRQNLIFVFHFADIEVIAQHVVQRATTERNSSTRRSRGELPGLCPDVTLSKISQQFIDAAKFEISPEDRPD